MRAALLLLFTWLLALPTTAAVVRNSAMAAATAGAAAAACCCSVFYFPLLLPLAAATVHVDCYGIDVAAFAAAQGAFTVLEWIAKAVKPLLWIGACVSAIALFIQEYKAH